jgi:integrase
MKPQHLGGDRWYQRVYAGKDPATGKKQMRGRVFRAPTEKAAIKIADRVRADLRDEIAAGKQKVGTVAGVTERWLAAGRWSPTTRARYIHISDRIVRDLGALRFDQLTAGHVDAWYRKLEATPKAARPGQKTKPIEHLSAQTVQHHRAVLRAIIKWGHKKYPGEVPSTAAVDNSSPPSVPRWEMRVPTAQAVQVLIDNATGPLRAAMVIAAHTGMRRGEILGLRWSDIDGCTMSVRRSVIQTKAGLEVKLPKNEHSRRTFQVDSRLIAELDTYGREVVARLDRAHIPTPDDSFVFADFLANRKGQTPRKPDWLTHAWVKHRTKYGAPTVRWHDLRHWHAITLLDAGVPLAVVSARLGHGLPSTTLDVYGRHVATGDDQRAAATIERVLRPAGELTQGEPDV